MAKTAENSKNRIIAITDLALGDDYAAMLGLVALARTTKSKLELVASYGNRSTNDTFENLLLFKQALESTGRQQGVEIKVYYGANKPTDARKVYDIPSDGIERAIHGDMGRDGRRIRAPKAELHSTSLYDKLSDEDNLYIISLAATTELLRALQDIPDLSRIASVVIMGGTISEGGNVNPHTEANFHHDPKANEKVIQILAENNISHYLVSLDTTEHKKVLFTPEVFDTITKGLAEHPEVLDMLLKAVGPDSAYGKFYLTRTKPKLHYPYTDVLYKGVSVHDLIAMMVLYDIMHGKKLFKYTNKVKIRPGAEASVAVARFYMEPFTYPTLVGDIKRPETFWNRLIEILKEF